MARIFISYRRDDTQDMTERLHDRLVRDLKGHQIFLDVERNAIPGAAHYKDVLAEYVQNCDVLIAIIGAKWLDIEDPLTGLRRLENPEDFVRIEVGTALQNNKSKVVPVLVHEAKVPHPSKLPEPLLGLLELQVVRVRNNPDFHQDVDKLVEVVKYYLPRQHQGISLPVFIGSLLVTALIAILSAYVIFQQTSPEKDIEVLNPSAVAVQLLTQIAQTNQAPTATPTIDITRTIQAIMDEISTKDSETQIAQVSDFGDSPDPTISSTPNQRATAAAIRESTATQARVEAAIRQELATQRSQLEENQPTNTPQPSPTATQTATPSPMPTATPSPDLNATATLQQATQIAESTQVYQQAIATIEAQFTATAIAFVNQQYGDLIYHRTDTTREIYRSFLDGSNILNLTRNGADDMRPHWSADGQWVVFDSYRSAQRDLYMMRPDGSEETRLTDDVRVAFAPVWSPDGSKIVYYAYTSPSNTQTNIYVLDMATREVTQLTDNTSGNTHPNWSAGGTKIVFASERGGIRELYIMNADGSEQGPLTNPTTTGSSPAWSPTRDELVFTSTVTGNFEIYRMNLDGSERIRLSLSGGDNRNPVWSSDGNWIAFESTLDGDSDIYIMDRDGKHLTPITFTAVDEAAPTWNPFVTVSETFLNRVACDGFMPSRLEQGGRARVTSGEALNLRAEATVFSELLVQLRTGAEILILEGPLCAEGFAWWRVEFEDKTGWLVEGSRSEYWLEPIRGG